MWKLVSKGKLLDGGASFITESKSPQKDLLSLRKHIYQSILLPLYNGGDENMRKLRKAADKKREANLQAEVKQVKGLASSIHTMDPWYTPFYDRPKAERDKSDGNVSDDEYARFEMQYGIIKKNQEENSSKISHVKTTVSVC